jgi:hypothetical protein
MGAAEKLLARAAALNGFILKPSSSMTLNFDAPRRVRALSSNWQGDRHSTNSWSKRSRTHRLSPGQQVKRIKEERPGAVGSAPALESRNVGLARLSGPKPGRWLARVFGKTGIPATSSPTRMGQRVGATPASKPLRYDAGEYNWASFFCPYCNASNFIKCGAGHLVCDSTVEMRNGRRFHRCFCGNGGFIEGTIKSYEATRQTLEQTNGVGAKPTSATAVKEASVTTLEPPAKKSETPLLR